MKKFYLAVCGVAVALAVCLVPAITVLGQEATEEAVPESNGVGAMVAQAQAMAAQAEADILERRIAVLEKLEAGEVSVEDAVGMLDAIPVPAARYQASGVSSWFRLEVEGSNEEVMIMVPSSLIRWAIVEGPKMAKEAISMMPEEERAQIPPQAMGFLDMDLSGFVMIVDSFARVSQETTVFHVGDGAEDVTVTVIPSP